MYAMRALPVVDYVNFLMMMMMVVVVVVMIIYLTASGLSPGGSGY
jgi:hypothetical protein